MKEFDHADDIYVVTLSSKLSGSYNSAVLAKQLYQEEHPDKNIEIIDSHSASVGQTLIAMKIKELIEMGHPFKTVAGKVNEFRDSLKTKFVLESRYFKEKRTSNGTSSNHLQCLNIKPVMGATPEGTICKLDQAGDCQSSYADGKVD